MTSDVDRATLHDAVQLAAAKLQAMDWQAMQPQAIAYAVIEEALPYLQAAAATQATDEETSRIQRAHDVRARETRERYPWIHQDDGR